MAGMFGGLGGFGPVGVHSSPFSGTGAEAGAPGTGGAVGPNLPGQAAMMGGGPSVEQMVLDLNLIPPSAMNPQTVAEASRAVGGSQALYNKWLDSRIASQIQATAPTQPGGGGGGGGTTPTTPTVPPVTPAPVTTSPLSGLTAEQIAQIFQGMALPQGQAVQASPMAGSFNAVQSMNAASAPQSAGSIAEMLSRNQSMPLFAGLGANNPMIMARQR